MITRDVAQLRTVAAVRQSVDSTTTSTDQTLGRSTFSASCGGMGGGTSTANHITGLIIDRLGLGRGYNSVLLSARAIADIGTSTLDAKFGSIMAWLYHSSTTCSDDFDRYSTESEKSRGILVLLNTTSTLASGFMATSTSAGTFGTFSATATGGARGEYDAFYSLAGAQRYLRASMIVEAYASSSGGTKLADASVDLIFGEPDEAPRQTTSTGALYKS